MEVDTKLIDWEAFADFVEAKADKAFKDNPKRFNIYFYFPQYRQEHKKDSIHILIAMGMYLQLGFVDSEEEQAYKFFNGEFKENIEIRINKCLVDQIEMIYDDNIKDNVCAKLYLNNGLCVVIFDYDYEV